MHYSVNCAGGGVSPLREHTAEEAAEVAAIQEAAAERAAAEDEQRADRADALDQVRDLAAAGDPVDAALLLRVLGA